MSRLQTLDLGGQAFAIDAPPQALEVLDDFFPGGILPEPPSPSARRFSIESIGEFWRLSCDGALVADRSQLVHVATCLEHEAGQVVLENLGDRVGFHAGAVEVGGKAVLVAGLADQGKSSTTLQLLEMGHAFLCEEIALYEPHSGCIAPYAQSVAVVGSFLDELRHHFPVTGGLREVSAGNFRYLPERFADGPVPVASILLPRYAPQEPPELTRLRAEDCLVDVLGYCFAPRMEQEQFLDALISLLERVPVTRMVYDGVFSARRLLDEVVGET